MSKLFPSEDAFKNDQKSIEILIAGHMYKIDFEEGVQARATYKPLLLEVQLEQKCDSKKYQTVGNLRRRRIKREKVSNLGANRKGTAGVPVNEVGLDILRLEFYDLFNLNTISSLNDDQ